MLFVMICTDTPEGKTIRARARADHIAYFGTIQSKVVHAGPMLDAEGTTLGSLIILEAADRAEVERIAAADPYAQAGVYASTQIYRHRLSIRDGERLPPA